MRNTMEKRHFLKVYTKQQVCQKLFFLGLLKKSCFFYNLLFMCSIGAVMTVFDEYAGGYPPCFLTYGYTDDPSRIMAFDKKKVDNVSFKLVYLKH